MYCDWKIFWCACLFFFLHKRQLTASSTFIISTSSIKDKSLVSNSKCDLNQRNYFTLSWVQRIFKFDLQSTEQIDDILNILCKKRKKNKNNGFEILLSDPNLNTRLPMKDNIV